MGQTLDCTAQILNLSLTAGRDRVINITANGFNSSGCEHLVQVRETPDLNSNVLFSLSSEGDSPQITQSSGANSVITFQFLAENTANLAGRTVYWSWKITFSDDTVSDWVAGFIDIQPSTTS